MIRTPLRRLGVAALAGVLAAGVLAAPASAAGRGTVQGTYTTDAGAPVEGAYVSAWSADRDWLRDTTTDAQGRFTLRNVTAGGVKIQFQNNGLEQWAHRAADFDTAGTFTLVENQTLTVTDRQLPTGRITGLVEEPSGGPAAHFTVHAERAGDSGGGTYGYADETGRYALDVLPGDYTVSFLRDATRQWAFGRTDAASAARFTVAAGATVEVDDTFLPTGTLGGRLTGADGTPVGDVVVALHRPYDPAAEDGDATVAETYTVTDGEYAFAGVLPGAYRVSFTDGDRPRQWLRGTADPSRAAAYPVVAGEHTVADDTVMRPGVLRGRLTDGSGAGLGGYRVRAGLATQDDDDRYTARTAADGTWSIAGVLPGGYAVSFENPQGSRRQFAYGAGTRAEADPVEVTGSATVTVDDTWLPGATLVVAPVDAVTGEPVGGFCAWLIDTEVDECTDGSTLTLTDLPLGTFTMDVRTDGKGFHLGTSDLRVMLTAGATTRTEVPLTQGGRSAVTVTDRATGLPVADTCFAFVPVGHGLGEGYGHCTNAAGKVTTPAMAAGAYQMFAVPRRGGYGYQWVGRTGGTGDQREAARVTLRPGRITRAPAVLLDPAGTVTGTVTGDDGRPVADADVSITAWDYGVGGSWGTGADATGRYVLTGLGPYEWPLVCTAYGYARQWSGGGGNRYQAAAVPVTAGGSTAYDIALARGSELRGTVTTPPGLPVADWRLTAVNVATGDPVGVADRTDAGDGTYTMPIAGGQAVQIRWSLYGDDVRQDGWWDGAADRDSATKVTVPRTGAKRVDLTIGR